MSTKKNKKTIVDLLAESRPVGDFYRSTPSIPGACGTACSHGHSAEQPPLPSLTKSYSQVVREGDFIENLKKQIFHLEKLGKISEALALFSRLEDSMEGKDPWFHLKRANLYEKSGSDSAAEIDYRNALKIMPTSAIAQAGLFKILQKQSASKDKSIDPESLNHAP